MISLPILTSKEDQVNQVLLWGPIEVVNFFSEVGSITEYFNEQVRNIEYNCDLEYYNIFHKDKYVNKIFIHAQMIHNLGCGQFLTYETSMVIIYHFWTDE